MKIRKRRPKVPGACPCHSGQPYALCCRPLHKGKAADDPTALMRSRYAAYALGDVRYIMKTTHPSGAHHRDDADAWEQDIRLFCRTTRFVGLEILEDGDDYVVFRARLTQNGEDASFVERSTFARHVGRWKYLEGEAV